MTTGATGPGQEHWDPNDTGLPLLAVPAGLRRQPLSQHFTVGELVRSGGRYADPARISPRLVLCLEAIRRQVGRPVRISSGYRSWSRNQAVYRGRSQQATKSRHCSGQAADISIPGLSGMEIAKAAVDSCGPSVAVGIGSGYAHIDVRGQWARWTYFRGATDRRAIAEIDAYRRQRLAGRQPGSGLSPVRSPASPAGGGATIPRALINLAARAARHGRGHLTLHLSEGWHHDQECLNLFEAACGPPAAPA